MPVLAKNAIIPGKKQHFSCFPACISRTMGYFSGCKSFRRDPPAFFNAHQTFINKPTQERNPES